MSADLDWAAVQAALQAWVVAGTELSATSVLWAGQGADRPTGAFASLRLRSDKVVGMGWVSISNRSPSVVGAELEYKVQGRSEVTLGIQVAGADAIGSAMATSLLHRLRTSASLPSQRARLRTANVGLLSVGTVQSLDGVINSTRFEARATLDVTLALASSLIEYVTYIETVQQSGTIDQ